MCTSRSAGRRADAPTARNGRASLRYNQGPNGSNTLLDEDAATGCLRDGTTRSGLQPHARNEHHGHPAPHGSDQGIVRPEKVQHLHSRPLPRMQIPAAPRAFLHSQGPKRTKAGLKSRDAAGPCVLSLGGSTGGGSAAPRQMAAPLLLHDDRRADLDPVIEIDHVLIGQANAAR